jgi:arginyl-tRNA synthetase
MTNLRHLLSERMTDALAALLGQEGRAVDPLVRAAQDPRHGDYQSNCAMGLAKRSGGKPRDVAAALVERLAIDDICEPPEIAGPGFINFRIKPAFMAAALQRVPPRTAGEDRLGLPRAASPDVVALDMSSPNLAKEMHVGHLRPTIIGDAVARALEFGGHTVHRINHIGDWGTQFGMLIQFLRESQPQVLKDPDSLRLGDLEEFYIRAKARFDDDKAFADRARKAVVDLQSGDPATLTIWKAFCDESLRHCHAIYNMLDIRLEDRGESFYNDMLPGVVAELQERGIAVESQGALCIFPEGFKGRDGERLPLIIRKSDGGYGYATTDLAALKHRIQALGATRLIYVVGNTQKQRFEMLFEALRMTGWAGPQVEAVHLPTGILLRDDGKPFKTREGGTVKLRTLLDEAIERERQFLLRNEQDPEKRRGYEPAQIEHMAQVLGLAAVTYFELSHNLATDYRFDWDTMLALDGNTAPYMLYTYARIQSIAGKAKVDFERLPAGAAIHLEHASEIALARQLLKLSECLEQLGRELRPNLLTEYLYDLSRTFSGFYDRNTGVRVVDAEPETVRISRLKLCDLTARALRLGLGLLGIRTLERM